MLAIALMVLGILFLKGYNVGTILAIYAIVYAIIRMITIFLTELIKGIKKAIEEDKKNGKVNTGYRRL